MRKKTYPGTGKNFFKDRLQDVRAEVKETGISVLKANAPNNTWIFITEDFIERCKKGKVWDTPRLNSVLENSYYGVDVTRLNSAGGKDGIYSLDRNYRPKNEMQKKIFDQFIDKKDSLFPVACMYFFKQPEEVIPIRVVSHHMNLVGILFRDELDGNINNLVLLVDFVIKKK